MTSSHISSPCKGVCLMDQPGTPIDMPKSRRPEKARCMGCSRSMEEIRTWSTMSDKERAEILRRIQYEKTVAPKFTSSSRSMAPKR